MKKTLILTALISSLALPALAQSHHPENAEGQAMQGGAMQGQGMMDGMMGGRGMMMGQGMMSCPMMGMMGQGHPRTEGRIAFLKAELKITDKQNSAWKTYADTLRQAMEHKAGKMGDGMMMQGGERKPAPEALQARITMLEGMISKLKTMQTATATLYSALDDAQKATADELLGMSCGMGGM